MPALRSHFQEPISTSHHRDPSGSGPTTGARSMRFQRTRTTGTQTSAQSSFHPHFQRHSAQGLIASTHSLTQSERLIISTEVVQGLSQLGANAFPTLDPARRALQTRAFLLAIQHAVTATERCPFPVIAAVHGAVVGLGIDIISACDVRYAASDATFSIKVRPFSEFTHSSLSDEAPTARK